MRTKDEIRDLSVEEIKAEIRKTQHELFQDRLKIDTGQEKDISKPSKSRTYIARLKTILKEKESNLKKSTQAVS